MFLLCFCKPLSVRLIWAQTLNSKSVHRRKWIENHPTIFHEAKIPSNIKSGKIMSFKKKQTHDFIEKNKFYIGTHPGLALKTNNGRVCVWDKEAGLYRSIWQVLFPFQNCWLMILLLFGRSDAYVFIFIVPVIENDKIFVRVNFNSGHSRLSEIRIMQVWSKV